MKKRHFLLIGLLLLVASCNFPSLSEEEDTVSVVLPQPSPYTINPTNESSLGVEVEWVPPRTAAEWLSTPVRGAVIEIGYGGPDEYNDPPYPSVESLQQLYDLGARVIVLEFQYAWTIEPPYQLDKMQYALITEALDNATASGLYVVLSVRNGPGRNAMMPDVDDADVITTLYTDETAQEAYLAMLRDLVERFADRSEIIAWEPLVEPVLDYFLTEEDSPYPRAAEQWNDLARQMIAAIREADSERPILIEPVNWGGTDGFILLGHFDDDNIIYSLHTYEPFAFSHQQDPPYVAYPGTFDGEYFDRVALDTLLAPVDEFQARYNVPIVVGEWGGMRWLPGIEQYITDQLALFEKRNWGWFWYTWDDEEWDELGFELHMGPERDAPAYDPTTPAFTLIVSAWQDSLPQSVSLQMPSAYEVREDGAIRVSNPLVGASDQNPAFSPDGTQIVFTRFENGYNDGPAGLFLLDFKNSEITRLTPWEDQDNVNLPGTSWNLINNYIVFASDRAESDDLWRIAPDGTDFSPITIHEGSPWYIEPSWSPDGEWIVFEVDNNVPDDEQQGSIWIVRADGSEFTQLTDGPGGNTDDRQPNWSPTGDRILFQRRVPGSENWDIYTVAPDGSDLQQVTTSPFSDTDTSWSPDGHWIVCSSDHSGLPVPNIFIVPAKGGEPIQVTYSIMNEDGAPSWSPNGKWIAFESHPGQEEDAPSALWLIPVPDINHR